jgi:hypothetical protein
VFETPRGRIDLTEWCCSLVCAESYPRNYEIISYSRSGLAKAQEFVGLRPKKGPKVLTKLYSYSNNIHIAIREGGHDGNSLLHEVSEEERNKEPEASNAQEPQTGNTGCLPGMWHQGIQNREALNSDGNRLPGLTGPHIRGGSCQEYVRLAPEWSLAWREHLYFVERRCALSS